MDNNINEGFSASQTAVKGGKKSALPFILGAVVLIALIGTALFAFVPSVNNSVKMAVMKPDKYLVSVESQNFTNYSKDIADSYKALLNSFDTTKGAATDCKLKVEIADSIKAQLEPLGVTGINSAAVSLHTNAKSNAMESTVALDINDQMIISANGIFDLEKLMAYVKSPELSSSYLSIPLTIDEMKDATDMLKAYDKQKLSPDDLEKLINKYGEMIYSDLKDVSLQKGVKGKVIDTDYTYNVLTVKMTYNEFSEKAIAILEELKNEQIIIDYVTGAEIYTKEEYTAQIDMAIAGIKEESESTEISDNAYFLIKTYIDNKGDIKGRDFSLYADGSSINSTLSYLSVETDKKLALEVNVNDSSEKYNVQINSDKNGKKYSGTIVTNADTNGNKATFNVTFTDVEIVNEEMGYFNGTFTIDTSSMGIDGINKLDFVCTTDNNSQNISFNIPDYALITLVYSMSEAKEIQMPSGSDTIYDAQTEFETYASEIDIDKFVADVETKTGLNLQNLLSSLMLGGGSDYSYDNDEYSNDDYSSDEYSNESFENNEDFDWSQYEGYEDLDPSLYEGFTE